MDPHARPSARRILASVALIGFLAGGAAAAWRAVDDQSGSTLAGMFDSQLIDLHLNGKAGVHGFLGSDNLAPGDRVPGVLTLATSGGLEPGLADLDIGVEVTSRGAQGVHRLDQALVVSRLAYGIDDLLTSDDRGRNLTAELDADQDGKVTVRELTRGVDDLEPPRPYSLGGTGFAVEVTFRPRDDAQSSDFGDQDLDIEFTFHLADPLEPDG